jgi:hypothetical protein
MNAPVVFTGNTIQQSHTEVLTAIPLNGLFELIRSQESLKTEIERLRKVAAMDYTAYQRVKTRLPYFCCAEFGNGIRKSENFVAISCFVIDLDKVPGDRMSEIRADLCGDPRVIMLFTSPGGHGLKVVFELAEPCRSLKDYSDFYKTFAYHLSEMYHLGDFLDKSTSDATRVSFLSHDPDIFYNVLNEPVVMSHYLPEPLQLVPVRPEKGETEKEEIVNTDLPEETYREILLKLNPDARHITSKKKQIFIPEQLNRVEPMLRAEFAKLGIRITEVRDINYGKKFMFSLGLKTGEVNLFYGGKGFSVVISPKSGTDLKLSEIGEMVIRKALAEGVPESGANPEAQVYQLN